MNGVPYEWIGQPTRYLEDINDTNSSYLTYDFNTPSNLPTEDGFQNFEFEHDASNHWGQSMYGMDYTYNSREHFPYLLLAVPT